MSDSPDGQNYKAHVSLNVGNVKRSVDFYRKMFGIEPAKVRAGYAKFDVTVPRLNLALNEAAVYEKGVLSHMGIQVPETKDVHRMKDRWLAAGLEIRDEMQSNCCYALHDKTWLQDPDGNEWEVFARLGGQPCEHQRLLRFDTGFPRTRGDRPPLNADIGLVTEDRHTVPSSICVSMNSWCVVRSR